MSIYFLAIYTIVWGFLLSCIVFKSNTLRTLPLGWIGGTNVIMQGKLIAVVYIEHIETMVLSVPVLSIDSGRVVHVL